MKIIKTLVTHIELSKAEVSLLNREYTDVIGIINRSKASSDINLDTLHELIQSLINEDLIELN